MQSCSHRVKARAVSAWCMLPMLRETMCGGGGVVKYRKKQQQWTSEGKLKNSSDYDNSVKNVSYFRCFYRNLNILQYFPSIFSSNSNIYVRVYSMHHSVHTRQYDVIQQ